MNKNKLKDLKRKLDKLATHGWLEHVRAFELLIAENEKMELALYDAKERIDKALSAPEVVCADQPGIDLCFNLFWKAGMRKLNKKKAKPAFVKYLKQNYCVDGPTIHDLTNALVKDIESRLNSGQLGFTEMHPTTYLSGERWNDEIFEQKIQSFSKTTMQNIINMQNVELD